MIKKELFCQSLYLRVDETQIFIYHISINSQPLNEYLSSKQLNIYLLLFIKI